MSSTSICSCWISMNTLLMTVWRCNYRYFFSRRMSVTHTAEAVAIYCVCVAVSCLLLIFRCCCLPAEVTPCQLASLFGSAHFSSSMPHWPLSLSQPIEKKNQIFQIAVVDNWAHRRCDPWKVQKCSKCVLLFCAKIPQHWHPTISKVSVEKQHCGLSLFMVTRRKGALSMKENTSKHSGSSAGSPYRLFWICLKITYTVYLSVSVWTKLVCLFW